MMECTYPEATRHFYRVSLVFCNSSLPYFGLRSSPDASVELILGLLGVCDNAGSSAMVSLMEKPWIIFLNS
jgi:hypothetical protein